MQGGDAWQHSQHKLWHGISDDCTYCLINRGVGRFNLQEQLNASTEYHQYSSPAGQCLPLVPCSAISMDRETEHL